MSDSFTELFLPSPELVDCVVEGYENFHNIVADAGTRERLVSTIYEGLLGLCYKIQSSIGSPFFLTTEGGQLEPNILAFLKASVWCHRSKVEVFNQEFARCILEYARKDHRWNPQIILHESGRAVLLPHYIYPRQPLLCPRPTLMRATFAKFGQGKGGAR